MHKKIQSTNKTIFNIAILSTAIFGTFFSPFANQAHGTVDCSLASDKSKCLELEKKAKAYQDLINIKNKTQLTIKNQLSLIDTQQQKNQIELVKTQDKAKDLTQQINNLDREINDKENLLKYQQAVLTSLMQSYYEYTQEGLLDIILLNQDFSEIFNQSDHIEQASSRVSDVLKTIQDTRAKLQNEYDDIQQKKQESEQIKSKLEGNNLDLQYNENQKQTLLSQTKGEEQKYQELLAKVREQQKQIEEEIQQIESGKSSTDLGPLPPAKSGLLAYPVNPINITQGYGKTSFSGHYASGLHNGIDFAINKGTIYAAGSGKILATGNNGKYAYGYWIAIDHGNGLVTLYGHLSKQLVSKGDSVKIGDKIGISGNTGYSTGPHLHFSVFAKKTFDLTESKIVSGLMIPTGTSLNPKNYL